MEQDILVFEIDDRKFGVPAALVVEVVRAVTPLSLPRASEVVMGIINIRGSVVPVLETRRMLRLPTREVLHTDHLIILRDGELVYAIHADRAIDLTRLQNVAGGEEGGAVDSEDMDLVANVGLIANTTLGFVQVLNPGDLLGDEDRTALSAIVSSTPANEIST